MRAFVAAGVVVSFCFAVAPAAAQPEDRRYNEEPTGGLETPASPLAGEFDALAVVTNPAGLQFLRGNHLGLVLHFDDDDYAVTGGAGYGVYDGFTVGGRWLPQMGLGFGVELLRPNRSALTPDPGEATRLSVGWSLGLGDSAALGLSWHAFLDDSTQPLHGVRSLDLGYTGRWGPHFAFGLVVRDVDRPEIDGFSVQRRYEAEVATRPTGTERLELALGGRLGETRLDVDGWLRWSWRVARGIYFNGEVAAQSLQEVVATPGGEREDTIYEGRLTAGLEISLGSTGFSGYGTLRTDDDGGNPQLMSATVVLRASSEQRSPLLGERKRIAQLDLSGPLGERSLTNAVLAMRDARRDDAVVAVFVRVDGVGGGWGTAATLRAELQKIRDAGKPVFAYLVSGTTRDYYIASVASKVWIDPIWGLRLSGIAATTLYFAGLFEKLGVLAQFEKIEEYKSAPEQFTRTEGSEPALRMRKELYDDMYATITDDIARGRGISAQQVEKLIDDGPYDAGALANLTQLVDGVVDSDKLGEAIRAEMGGRSYPFAPRPLRRQERWAHPSIAVVFADGDIVSGKSQTIPLIGRRLIGSETIAGAIASARADSDVEAIVLRIDSPGGSAVGSEMMAREIFKTRGVKPIICSMGDVAASGGYFIAAGCDIIYAEPTTITGSIGIFTGKFDVSQLLDRIGVTFRTDKRGRNADRESFFQPYTDEDRVAIRKQIRYSYDRFVGYVAKGRNLTPEQVDAVGRGRVWTGRQAKQVGLVDELGGLGDAIARAKQEAGIPEDLPTELVYLPDTSDSLLSRLLNFRLIAAPDAQAGEGTAEALLPGGARLLDAVPGSLWAEPDEPQARLPFAIVWE